MPTYLMLKVGRYQPPKIQWSHLNATRGRLPSNRYVTYAYGGGARLNFKTSRGCVYKCLSLIVSFAVTVAIWPREVVSGRDFILHAVATFWAMSLVGIYPGKVSWTKSRCHPV